MSWVVVKQFADAKDNHHVYHAGDSFPRIGKQVDEKRLIELSTDANALKTPLIAVVEEKVEVKVEETKPKKTAKAKSKE